jgi:two-component system sensor kinase FixL
LQDHGVAVQYHLEPKLPPVIGDRAQLQQVIVNLFVNARDAIDAADPPQRVIAITTHSSANNMVELSVTDSGAGAAEDVIARVFDPFFTTKDDGMGLGLSICRTIVGAHGGRIWAEPSAAAGLTFHCTLPICH